MAKSNVTFHGPVSSSIINIDSTLTNVKQMVGTLTDTPPDQRKKLEDLVDELRQQLAQAPAEKKSEAEAIAKLTEELVAKAKNHQPKPLIEMAIKNLKEAGSWVVDTLPKVPAAVAAIAQIVAML
jgi:hypothetical protein